MSFEKVELSEISTNDLSAFLEGLRAKTLETKNRVFFDLFAIVERELLARHQSTEIADYYDDELRTAINELASLVDYHRAQAIPDDYAFMKFLLYSLTGLINEAERRGLVMEPQ